MSDQPTSTVLSSRGPAAPSVSRRLADILTLFGVIFAIPFGIIAFGLPIVLLLQILLHVARLF